MKLLILSSYFPPDLCAGSFRCGALVHALRDAKPDGMCVEVITTQPHRYKNAVEPAPDFEESDGISIHRIKLPDHNSGMVDQARSFATFARQALKISRAKGPFDAVFATSSRLMTAALGSYIARQSGARLYLDIRDLFVETLSDVLGGAKAAVLLPVFKSVERATFGSADRINIVSSGFRQDIARLAPLAELSEFTNGIDDEFAEYDWSASHSTTLGRTVPVILYAGNIGEGQGLHNIIPEAARLLYGKATFRILGDGGRRSQLLAAVEGLDNVTVCPAVLRSELMREYLDCDILLLHLNDHPAFLKVLPSKLFEYGATGHPILAGVSGVASEFITRELPDCAVFEPCDAAGLAEAFERQLRGRTVDRTQFIGKYSRSAIMRSMAEDLIDFTDQAAAR